MRLTQKLMPVLLTLSLTLIGFHVIHTVRIKLFVLQAAAYAGEKKLGCLPERPSHHRHRVDDRPDLHRSGSQDPQILGILMHVPLRPRRRSIVQRNTVVHDFTA